MKYHRKDGDKIELLQGVQININNTRETRQKLANLLNSFLHSRPVTIKIGNNREPFENKRIQMLLSGAEGVVWTLRLTKIRF